MEPYYEKKKVIPGEITYPFACFITDNNSLKPYVPPHFHEYIEIIYALEGEMKLQIGNENLLITEGSVAMIDSGEVHSTYIDTSSICRCIILKFEPEIFKSAGASLEMRYLIPFINPAFVHQRLFTQGELVDEIKEELRSALLEFSDKQYGFDLAIRISIFKIFLWLIRNSYSLELIGRLEKLNKTVNIDKLQLVLKYVELNYSEDISMEAMAALCNMSYSYFSRQFSKIIGKSFKEYLNYVRVSEAEKLLLTTDLKITEIAIRTGFTNSSYFIKLFKLYKNISPKQFRANLISIDKLQNQ